jgi:hypothetical protein
MVIIREIVIRKDGHTLTLIKRQRRKYMKAHEDKKKHELKCDRSVC